ncbi:hypothetical protein BGX21_003689 [Mortierella sp. AD011]|nr:hypothetical protein BGX20_004044 [Mortierella sp. AD010]KAF9400701.1 hypothetical protein BGX21_003689 [Mortierella sp. AD011]
MLKYVKDGALDLLALTLPSSILESIRQVSEDDFLSSTHSSSRQQLPPMSRRTNPSTSWIASRAVAPNQRKTHAADNVLSSLSSPMSQHDTSKPTIQIPYEILALIFQYLPASDLFSVVAVNRLWRQIAFLETKQIDLSECFPMDCLGLENEVYSDFDFVYNLFSMFPLISSLVIKDRYMRDRDMRVVTAGILAGKMAFTETKGPAIGSDAYRNAQQAVAIRRQQQDGSTPGVRPAQLNTTAKPVLKVMRKTLKEDLQEFSRSIATYVLIPQTRNTLRKKILERLEHNLEQKEIQDYLWMLENDIDPSTSHLLTSTSIIATASASSLSKKNTYPLVPITHYRFHDCCFAKDWGAVMDVNKLPMIGLAASISAQGLVVDLEGSYGAPSQSIKTMLGFCFGAHCVLSLELNFRHTHMELEHVVELLSENPILYKIDIVDSPAFHDLIRLPALRGLGSIVEKMQEACLDLDETQLEESLRDAKLVLSELEKAIELEEIAEKDDLSKKQTNEDPVLAIPDEEMPAPFPTYTERPPRVVNDFRRPIQSLSKQLVYVSGTSPAGRLRTAKVLLMGVIHHGITGLINTRDRNTGQSLLHTLAWRRSYYSLTTIPTNSLPTPPSQHQRWNGLETNASPFFSSSFPPSSPLPASGTSSLLPTYPSLNLVHHVTEPIVDAATEPQPISEEPQATTTSSGLSSLISISTLPAALSSALSFRRLSLPATLWIPMDSEDIGVGGGSLPTPDLDDDEVHSLFADNSVGTITDVELLDGSTVEPTEAAAVAAETQDGLTDDNANRPLVIPEQHPVAIALRMAKVLLEMNANPNVYNKDGRSAVVCASFMGFQPMEALLIEHGGYSKEFIRIRETM